MNLDSMYRQLAPYLERADFGREDADCPEIGRPSRSWQSQYGILLCVDASTIDISVLHALTRRCDAYLADRIERTARTGVELDAHLCMFVDSKFCSSSYSGANSLSEIEESRFVSRKYFLDSAKAAEEIIGRLTLLWPNIEADTERPMDETTPALLSELRSRIASATTGRSAAKAFLEPFDDLAD